MSSLHYAFYSSTCTTKTVRNGERLQTFSGWLPKHTYETMQNALHLVNRQCCQTAVRFNCDIKDTNFLPHECVKILSACVGHVYSLTCIHNSSRKKFGVMAPSRNHATFKCTKSSYIFFTLCNHFTGYCLWQELLWISEITFRVASLISEGCCFCYFVLPLYMYLACLDDTDGRSPFQAVDVVSFFCLCNIMCSKLKCLLM